MKIGGATLQELLVLTVRDPRAAAAQIIAAPVGTDVLWQALCLVAVLLAMIMSGMIMFVLGMQSPSPEGTTSLEIALLQPFASSPILLAFEQACVMALMVHMVHWVGRSFGGRGALSGAIAVVTWLQFFMICVMVGLVFGVAVLSLALPPLAMLLVPAAFALIFWQVTQYICELHGFTNALAVFGMIILCFLALNVIVSIILGLVKLILGVGSP